MKATMRKSGVRMFSMHVEHHVDYWQLVTLLARGESFDDSEWDPSVSSSDSLTRSKVLKAMRERLGQSGPYGDGALDDVEDLVIENAKIAVSRLFPELKDVFASLPAGPAPHAHAESKEKEPS